MKEKTQRQKIGSIGEDIAVKFLVKHDFVILERNYLKKFGEIDIICRKSGKVHFIEVKTVSRETSVISPEDGIVGQSVSRETSDEYRAEDNVHPTKLRRIGRTIEVYIAEKDIKEDWEFHVVLIVLDNIKKTAKVRFLRDLII